MQNTSLSRIPRKSLGHGSCEASYLEAGTGKPLLLLHDGAPGAEAASGWNGAIEALSAGRRILAIDTLGFGHSARPSADEFEYSQQARTRHVIAFIEAADLAPVDLIGNSMGAITALDVAASRPDLAGRIALVAPAGLKSAIPEAAAPLLAYRGRREGMREIFEVLSAPGFHPDEAILDYRFRSYQNPSTQCAWHAAMQWIGEQGGLYLDHDVIASVEATVLVIAGKLDPLIPPALAMRFVELIEHCSCYFAADCGHWVVLEQRRTFLELCAAFFGAGHT